MILIFGIIIVAGILAFFLFNKFSATGEVTNSQPVKTVPLSAEERQKVTQTVLSTEFIHDIPEKDPVVLTFFSFENGQRVWRDGFLMGKGRFLSEGEPTIYLMLHSKYISEFNGNNLCEIIQRANKNGDLAFHSEYGKASLLIKYTSMLKHRQCFGF